MQRVRQDKLSTAVGLRFDDGGRTEYDMSKNHCTSTMTGKIEKGNFFFGSRMRGAPLRHVSECEELCGADALQNIILTMTMWDWVTLKLVHGASLQRNPSPFRSLCSLTGGNLNFCKRGTEVQHRISYAPMYNFGKCNRSAVLDSAQTK
jgi:hypothetical protein